MTTRRLLFAALALVYIGAALLVLAVAVHDTGRPTSVPPSGSPTLR